MFAEVGHVGRSWLWFIFENGNWFKMVFSLVIALLVINGVRAHVQSWSDARFATLHGCKPAIRLKNAWPLGLDLLLKAFRLAKAQRVLQLFVSIVEETGTTFEQRLLGSRGIDTVDPKNIEAILSTQFNDFGLGDRRPTFYPLLGDGIFTQDSTSWRHSRELLRPQFSSNRSQKFNDIREHAQSLIECIPRNKVVDLQPLFFRFTLDTTTSLLFGKSINSLKVQKSADKASAFAEAFDLAQDYLARRGRLGALYWLIGGSEFRRACAAVHEFVDDIVRNALETGSASSGLSEPLNYVFINALIQENHDPIVLRDHLLNILLAGRDTTACCLSWTFRLLARHQKVLNRLREEIRSVAGLGEHAKPPERKDLKKMTYLSLVLKEVLRLYPSVPVNSRSALKTTILPTGGGPDGQAPVLVRRGEAVGYCAYVMHRRKDLYGLDADCFRPERWEVSSPDGVDLKNIGWGYLPFNGGPRVCLGQEFALLEASYAIVRLIQTFPTIKPPLDEPLAEVGAERQKLTLVLASAEGCLIEMG